MAGINSLNRSLLLITSFETELEFLCNWQSVRPPWYSAPLGLVTKF